MVHHHMEKIQIFISGKLTTFYSIRRKLSTFGIIHLLPYCINFAPSIRTQTSNYYL